MSNSFDNTNRGAAFPRIKKHPKAPDFSGPINFEGKDAEISIWETTSKDGKPYLSIKFGPKWEPGNTQDHRERQEPSKDNEPSGDYGQEIPF